LIVGGCPPATPSGEWTALPPWFVGRSPVSQTHHAALSRCWCVRDFRASSHTSYGPLSAASVQLCTRVDGLQRRRDIQCRKRIAGTSPGGRAAFRMSATCASPSCGNAWRLRAAPGERSARRAMRCARLLIPHLSSRLRSLP